MTTEARNLFGGYGLFGCLEHIIRGSTGRLDLLDVNTVNRFTFFSHRLEALFSLRLLTRFNVFKFGNGCAFACLALTAAATAAFALLRLVLALRLAELGFFAELFDYIGFLDDQRVLSEVQLNILKGSH